MTLGNITKNPPENIYAKVYGQNLTTLPKNLYIPPQALEVYLQHFEGPLDLLLYLIKAQGLNILDIPVKLITQQYLEYIKHLPKAQFELASDYLAMAATLIDIKARMLLPRPVLNDEGEVIDPRLELAQRLIIYEAIKLAAQQLIEQPKQFESFWPICIKHPHPLTLQQYMPSPISIAQAWQALCQRQAIVIDTHTVAHRHLSLRSFMSQTMQWLHLQTTQPLSYISYFELLKQQFNTFYLKEQTTQTPLQAYVVMTLNALLELVKMNLIHIEQKEMIYIYKNYQLAQASESSESTELNESINSAKFAIN